MVEVVFRGGGEVKELEWPSDYSEEYSDEGFGGEEEEEAVNGEMTRHENSRRQPKEQNPDVTRVDRDDGGGSSSDSEYSDEEGGGHSVARPWQTLEEEEEDAGEAGGANEVGDSFSLFLVRNGVAESPPPGGWSPQDARAGGGSRMRMQRRHRESRASERSWDDSEGTASSFSLEDIVLRDAASSPPETLVSSGAARLVGDGGLPGLSLDSSASVGSVGSVGSGGTGGSWSGSSHEWSSHSEWGSHWDLAHAPGAGGVGGSDVMVESDVMALEHAIVEFFPNKARVGGNMDGGGEGMEDEAGGGGGGGGGLGGGVGGGGEEGAIMSPREKRLMLCALLDRMVDGVAEHKGSLFTRARINALCSHLFATGALIETTFLDELSEARARYVSALPANMFPPSGVPMGEGAVVGPVTSVPRPLLSEDALMARRLFHNASSRYESGLGSRYYSEFEELQTLGKGAFGSVFHVKNRLDKAEYAVKKIALPSLASSLVSKYLREVTHLAKLSHSHVVRYYGAWIELLPASLAATLDDDDEYDYEYDDDDDDDDGYGEDDGPVVRVRRNEKVVWTAGSMDDSRVGCGMEASLFNSRTMSRTTSSDSMGNKGESRALVQFGRKKTSTRGLRRGVAGEEPPAFVPHLFIQMELCSRTTLQDYLESRKGVEFPFTRSELEVRIQIAKALLSAVRYVHEAGILHRDLKPANVFLSQDGSNRIKLGDFGLAVEVRTKAHTPVGTPVCTPPGSPGVQDEEDLFLSGEVGSYTRAPEQCAGGKYGSAADVYSLGICLYELFSSFGSGMERVLGIQALIGHGKAPETAPFPTEGGCATSYPHVASVISLMVAYNPESRPSLKRLMQLTHDLSVDNAASGGLSSTAAEVVRLDRLVQSQAAEIARLKALVRKLGGSPSVKPERSEDL